MTTSSIDSVEVELYDPLFHTPQEDVYEIYALLRDEYPVYHCGRRDVWCISRHEDVQRAARDAATFANSPGVDIDAPNYMGPGNFLDGDPPRHDVLRNVVRRSFTPKAIGELEGEVERRVADMLTEISGRERIDLAYDYAWQLPIWVICRLLGVPESDDARVQETLLRVFVREPGESDVPTGAEVALADLQDYLRGLIEFKRRSSDGRLLSHLVEEATSGVLVQEEVVGMATLFFIAGSETTFALIANALNLLAHDPSAAEQMRHAQDPAVANRIIDEVLRCESPVQYLARTVNAETTIRGTTIPQGSRAVLIWAAANRDAERWENAERFDVGREPRRSVAFGEGIHFCLGAHLARLEARVAVPAFLRAYPNYEIVEGKRLQSHIVRGWERLITDLRPTA